MKRQQKEKMIPTFLLVAAVVVASGVAGCGRRGPEKDLRGELAALAGVMAAEKDLREVRFLDLNNDGVREVILVFGPRELLNFDVFYREKNGSWKITPMVNDRNNPREFVGSRLEEIGEPDEEGIPRITVSSLLYDGNTMIKEIRWNPDGYSVLNQRTQIAGQTAAPPRTEPSRPAATAPASRPQAAQSSQTPQRTEPRVAATPTAQTGTAPAAQAAAAPARVEPETPKPAPIPPVVPEVGTYVVRKGDTVFGLANALGISPSRLEELNGNQLQRRGLRIGQRINVPVPSGKKENVQVRIQKESYTVRSGDNLTGIAVRFGTSIQAIRSWNPSIPADGTIKVGQTLSIHHVVLEITA